VLPLNGIQIHDTKRKIVFPNIKNKFRFVTVSLLLASLVTVISSASALTEPEPFSFTVTNCTEGDDLASWSPSIDPALTDETVEAGDTGNVYVVTGFENGMSGCDYTPILVDGRVTSTLVITGVEALDWNILSACSAGCDADDTVFGISGTYVVPTSTPGETIFSGVFTLIWAP